LLNAQKYYHLGGNFDQPCRFKNFTESYLPIPEKDYASLGHSAIFVGRADGINEKGLDVAISGDPHAYLLLLLIKVRTYFQTEL